MNDEDEFSQCIKMWLYIGELKARLQREPEKCPRKKIIYKKRGDK